MAMIPALQFDNWQWRSLTLASPVVVWGAWPFHKAAWENARHGAASMDTLISLGVLAAYLWSVYALPDVIADLVRHRSKARVKTWCILIVMAR